MRTSNEDSKKMIPGHVVEDPARPFRPADATAGRLSSRPAASAGGWRAALPESSLVAGLSMWQVFLVGLAGAGCFHIAYAVPRLSFLLLGAFVSFGALSLARSRRKAFYPVLLIGLALYAPQLGFFWTIFGAPAILLWLVLASWLALFSVIAWRIRTRWGVRAWLIALPFLWTGLEYLRSELYYLRFSWINAAYALAELPSVPWLVGGGMYLTGFVLMSFAALTIGMNGKQRLVKRVVIWIVLVVLMNLPRLSPAPGASTSRAVKVAGIQAEFPQANHVPHLLDKALAKFPAAELFVLSEYTFDGPVPTNVLTWCQRNAKHLIVGGKDPTGDNYYNTSFVVSPAGEIVFKQVKSVPIQFFADGLPAPQQSVWESPWGKLGLCTCYDLSYTRVTDELIRQGALAIINPTMDVMDWGAYQHQLHSRVAPVRAAEYGVPIFRVASSGVSQLVGANGRVVASAPIGGDEAVVGGELTLASAGHLPFDRWLAPLCAGISGFLLVLCFIPDRKAPSSIACEPSNS